MNVPVTVFGVGRRPDDERTAVVVRKVEPVAAARLHGSLGQRVVPDLLQQRILFRILRLFRLRSSCVRILRIGIFRIGIFRIGIFRIGIFRIGFPDRDFRIGIFGVGILRIRVFRIRLFRFAQAYGYLDPGDGVGGRVEDVRNRRRRP